MIILYFIDVRGLKNHEFLTQVLSNIDKGQLRQYWPMGANEADEINWELMGADGGRQKGLLCANGGQWGPLGPNGGQ